MSETAINVAIDIVGVLLIVGISSSLWLPFLVLVVVALRRAWREGR